MPLASAVRADALRPTTARPRVSSVSRVANGAGTRPLPQLSPMPTTSTRATSCAHGPAAQREQQRRRAGPEQRFDDEDRVAVVPAVVDRPERVDTVAVGEIQAEMQKRRQNREQDQARGRLLRTARSSGIATRVGPPRTAAATGSARRGPCGCARDGAAGSPAWCRPIRVYQVGIREISADDHHGNGDGSMRAFRQLRRGHRGPVNRLADQGADQRVSQIVHGRRA